MELTEQAVITDLVCAQSDEERLRIEAAAITASDNSARDGDADDQFLPLVVTEEGSS